MNKLFISIVSSILAFSMLLADYEITDEGVVFTYSDSTARQVFLAGDFNDWKTDDLAMERKSDGIFRKLVKLSPGRYEYKFIVDGKWKNDPDNPNTVSDPYGGKNSVLVVPAYDRASSVQGALGQTESETGKAVFKYYNPDADEVYLAGEFNNWNPKQLAMQNDDGEWTIAIELEPGEYEYKFVVDGNWTSDPLNPVIRGDMGNSVIKVNQDGTASYPSGAKLLTNTTASSRVFFGGLFASQFITYRDRDMPGHTGDRRWKLYDPEVETDINLRVHIAEGVTAFASLGVNAFEAETIYAAHISMDSVGVNMTAPHFSVGVSYNREFLEFDDLLGLLGHYQYAEPTFQTPQKFGIGYAGIAIQSSVDKTFMRNTHIELLFANMFKDWALQTDSLDFSNIIGRRNKGFWSIRTIRSDEPADFSDFGTDVLAGRIYKKISFITPGATFRLDRNRWWLPLDEISYARMDTIISEHSLQSDWFNIGSVELGLGGDITIDWNNRVILAGEYISWQYRSSIDAGNRENSDHTADSTLDITLGKQDGYLAGAKISVNLPLGLYTSIYAETEYYNPMDTDQVYVLPQHNDGSTGRPTLLFESMPEFRRELWRLKIGYNHNSLNISSSFVNELTHSQMNVSAAMLEFDLSFWRNIINLMSKTIVTFGNSYSSAAEFDGVDAIFNTTIRAAKRFQIKGDIYFKSINYKLNHSQQSDSGAVEPDQSISDIFISPYLAFIYQPRQSINLELSLGVRPYNLQGKYTGRTEWIYYTMENSSLSYRDVLKRMSLYQAINLVATVKF